MQQGMRNRAVEAGQHPDRGSVDHARDTVQRILDAVGDMRAGAMFEPRGQARGLAGLAVENPQLIDA